MSVFKSAKLQELLRKHFGNPWNEEERGAYENYEGIAKGADSWSNILKLLHTHFKTDIEDFDIDKKTGYFTNNYKEKVRIFCSDLFSINYVIENGENNECIKKWISGWFDVSDSNIKRILFSEVLPDCEFYIYGVYQNNWPIHDDNSKKIYLKAVDYHKNQGFKFNENETAVKQLLQYFDKTNFTNQSIQLDEISGVLNQHIKVFGDKSDYGYAYSGFDVLEKYLIGENIPKYLIERILQKYLVSEVLSNRQFKKQINKIIELGLKDQKEQMKMLYIDAPLVMSFVLWKLFFDQRFPLVAVNYDNIYRLGDREFSFKLDDLQIENSTLNEEYFNWKIDLEESDKKVVLYLEQPNSENCLLTIWLNYEPNRVIALFSDNGFDEKRENTKLSISLNDIIAGNEKEKIGTFFSAIRSNLIHEINELKEEKFTTSENSKSGLIIDYLYVDKYKSLNDFQVWFTNQDKFKKRNTDDFHSMNKSIYKSSVYGEKIESLTCIVGKNGSGKTTLIQFMTKILYPTILQAIELKDIKNTNSGKEDTFFAIVTIGENQYFVGNNKFATHIDTSELKALSKEAANEAVNLWGVYDFSNSLSPFSNGAYRDFETKKVERTKYDGEMTPLKNWSEDSLREQSRIISTSGGKVYDSDRAIQPYLNFCMEIIKDLFAGMYTKHKELEKEPRANEESLRRINNYAREIMDGIPINKFLNTASMTDDLRSGASFLTVDPNEISYERFCQEASSGQFTKLVFFSKIYAAICRNNSIDYYFQTATERFNNELKKDITRSNNSASTILFIDESELYQHPEWQRKFMFLLLEMLNIFAPNTKYQIIISTNSPFFLSDVFDDDIYYMNLRSKSLFEERTFGQNIHTLLSQEFFMEHTIGEISYQMIRDLFHLLGILEWREITSNSDQINIDATIFELASKISDLSSYFNQHLDDYFTIITSKGKRNIRFDTAINSKLVEKIVEDIRKSIDEDVEEIHALQSFSMNLSKYIKDNRKSIFNYYFIQLFPRIEYHNEEEQFIFLKNVIESIGEKVYRNTLQNSLERCTNLIRQGKNRKEFLEKQIAILQSELNTIGRDQYD